MSGGQNHKGIERLNIFLGAGCKDAPGKGVQMGIFCPVAFLEILCPSSRLLHGGLLSCPPEHQTGVSGRHRGVMASIPARLGWLCGLGPCSIKRTGKKTTVNHQIGRSTPSVAKMGSGDQLGMLQPLWAVPSSIPCPVQPLQEPNQAGRAPTSRFTVPQFPSYVGCGDLG